MDNAHSRQKTPSVMISKSGAKSTFGLNSRDLPLTRLILWVGRRGPRIRTDPITRNGVIISAIARIVHAKPSSGNNLANANGKTIPPKLPPHKATAVAVPLYLKNHSWTVLTVQVSKSDVPRPPSSPNTRKKCQYILQRPRSKYVAITKADPIQASRRGPYISKKGPICMPAKKDIKV